MKQVRELERSFSKIKFLKKAVVFEHARPIFLKKRNSEFEYARRAEKAF